MLISRLTVWVAVFSMLFILVILSWCLQGGRAYAYEGLPELHRMFQRPAPHDEPSTVPYAESPATPAGACHFTQPYHQESRGERECRVVLERLFCLPFPRKRPNILRNFATGRNLEFDGYNAQLKLAFEYKGRQHYHYPNRYHRSEAEYDAQQMRNEMKRRLSDAAGVYLISVPYHVALPKIRDFIIEKLPPTLARFYDLNGV